MVTTTAMSTANSTASSKDAQTTTATVRIVSLLPFITDIVHELNLSRYLVGTSHECDHTAKCAAGVRRMTSAKLDSTRHSDESAEISAGWSQTNSYETRLIQQLSDTSDLPMRDDVCSFYRVDMRALRSVRPTHILTHIDAHAHGPHDTMTEDEVVDRIKLLIPSVQHVLSLNATTLNEVYAVHNRLVRLFTTAHPDSGVVSTGRILLNQIRTVCERMRAPAQRDNDRQPSIAVVQWLDPLYLSGAFVPELAQLVGARLNPPAPRPGGHSVPLDGMSDLLQFDCVVFVPCGLHVPQIRAMVDKLWLHESHNRKARTIQTDRRGGMPRFAIADGVRLFSWMGLSNVVRTAQVMAEIVHECEWFGHKNHLWEAWSPPVAPSAM